MAELESINKQREEWTKIQKKIKILYLNVLEQLKSNETFREYLDVKRLFKRTLICKEDHHQSQPKEVVSYYKYLGVFLSSGLNWSWSCTAWSPSVQAQKALWMIKVVLSKSQRLPLDMVFEIFDKSVTPILTNMDQKFGEINF